MFNSSFFKYSLITVTLILLFVLLFLPLLLVFIQSMSQGMNFYIETILEDETLNAIKLTLSIASISVFLNMTFGVCAAWCICKFNFFGKNLITTLIDMPLTVSPVISGYIFILLFGSNSVIGKFLYEHDIKIIFAFPGLVIATIFVTLPFIVKELVTLMESQGSEEEEAAILLGASPLKVFFYITIPKIKWGLIYGILLCNARAMGEFGAVSVVSGHIRGYTNTVPLHVETLYNEYNFNAAFAVSSTLTILCLISLTIKKMVEYIYTKNNNNDHISKKYN